MPRGRRLLLLIVGLAVGLWAAACAVLLVGAARDLRAGRDAASSARESLDATAIAEGDVLDPLRTAADHFESAADATSSPILAPVRILPIAGRQLRSVAALSEAAGTVSDAGADAVAQAQRVLDEPSGGGPARVDQVRVIAETVRSTLDRLDGIDDLGPRVGLLRPLAEARNDLVAELEDARAALTDASAGADAALALLEGPRRYLLVAANNAEMRAGSGMWLSGGVLTTAGGRIELGDVGSLFKTADPPDDEVPITDRDLAARWGFWNPTDDFRGLMTSPRFPVAAEHALRMWQTSRGERLDGVIVVDPVALAAVARATGPVQVGDLLLEADDVEAELLHNQYLRFDDVSERRDVLDEVASAAFDALDAGEWSAATLIEELAAAIRGRHLLAWTPDQTERAGWEAAGMTGELSPDSMLVSVLNRGGNKLDYFLDVDAELEATGDGSGTGFELRLDIDNETPEGLPTYVTGPPRHGTWPAGTYVGMVAVTLPAAAEDVSIEGPGTRRVTSGPDGPAQVVAAAIEIAAGAEQRLVVRFRMPERDGVLVVEPSARVPPTNWTYGTSSWQDNERRAAKW